MCLLKALAWLLTRTWSSASDLAVALHCTQHDVAWYMWHVTTGFGRCFGETIIFNMWPHWTNQALKHRLDSTTTVAFDVNDRINIDSRISITRSWGLLGRHNSTTEAFRQGIFVTCLHASLIRSEGRWPSAAKQHHSSEWGKGGVR